MARIRVLRAINEVDLAKIIKTLNDVAKHQSVTLDFLKSRHSMPQAVWRSAINMMTRKHGGCTASTYTWDGKLPELKKQKEDDRTVSMFMVYNQNKRKMDEIMSDLPILTKWQPAAHNFLDNKQ